MIANGVGAFGEDGEKRFFGVFVFDAKERVLLWRLVSSESPTCERSSVSEEDQTRTVRSVPEAK